MQSAAGFGLYCSTKFAVEGITEALHAELAPLGIHATVVEPGYFRTEFLDSASLAVSPRVLDDYAESAGAVREAARRINLNQPGDPVRLAQAVMQLVASPTPPLRLPMLDRAARYRVARLDPTPRDASGSPLDDALRAAAAGQGEPLVAHGAWLAQSGLPLPRMLAESALIYRFCRDAS